MKVLSFALMAAMAALSLLNIYLGQYNTGFDYVALVGPAILLIAYLWSPRSYEVADGTLLIHRLAGAVRIPLGSIRELRSATAADFVNCNRLWASGGLFGYYGRFSTARLGKSNWYVTDRSCAVVLVTDSATILLSPADVSEFLACVRGLAPVPQASSEQNSTLAGAAQVVPRLLKWIAPAVVLLVTALVGAVMLYSPGPPRLTLTAGSLTIHDRFYPVTVNAADVNLAGIRVVDIATDRNWAPTARTNGFSNAHYHSGWYRVASGEARMYWSGATRLVLLPPRHGGAPVLLEAAAPDHFAETLRREWGGS